MSAWIESGPDPVSAPDRDDEPAPSTETDRAWSVTRMVRPSPTELALLVGIALVHTAALVAMVLGIRWAIDGLAEPGSGWGQARGPVIVVAVASVVLAVGRAGEYVFAEQIGHRHVGRLRQSVYDKVSRLPVRTIQRISKGAILLRLTGDLSMLRTWVSRGISRAVSAGIVAVAVIAILVWMHPLYAAAVLAPLLVGTGLAVLVGDQVRKATRLVRRRRSLITSNLAEFLSAFATVRAFGRSQGERNRFDAQNSNLVDSLVASARVRGRLRLVGDLTAGLCTPAVLVVAAVLLPIGSSTIGEAIAAITAARYLRGSLRTLARSYEYRQPAMVSASKIAAFFNRSEEPSDPDWPSELKLRTGILELRDVVVNGSLDGVNLTLLPGQVTAIMGPNGAGKSTLLNVVARLVTPDSGMVTIGGLDALTGAQRTHHRRVGFVSDDLPLMRGTLRRAITYRDRNADPAEIERVVTACRVDETIAGHRAGIDMWIEEGGVNLSAGNRQRVMFARALLNNPAWLLIDEGTTHIDDATREVFRRLISRYEGSVLWVTSDPLEAMIADQVVVMDAGKITKVIAAAEFRQRYERVDRVGVRDLSLW